ncbi:MAG TPA: FAD-dependent oxidoreductase [Thermoanaerobaculia bacterium]|nr:FAD-dependent oxidoreductase [Thermoanaerobaculia bacterium]
MHKNILILGGGYGGTMAAARIAKRGIPVTLVDARRAFVERIRLHQVAAGDDIEPVPYARIFRDLPVSFVQARVTRIDRAEKRVLTTAGALPYDELVYALGSEGAGMNPAAIRERLQSAKKLTIVGGGLTGIELASEIAERHPHVGVTLVDRGTIGHGLSSRALRHLHDWLAAHGVEVIEHREVTNDPDAIFCTSFTLSPIAREAGLHVNGRGQIIVDDRLRSSDPSIYAIGDAAECRDYRMSCALALPMGAYVADLLAGATREPFRFGFFIQCISLGRNDGIIQFVNPDDTPRERAITGRPAAWIKELVCRYAAMSLRLETRGVHYHWPKPEEAAA